MHKPIPTTVSGYITALALKAHYHLNLPFKLLIMRKFLLALFVGFAAHSVSAQSLVVNELSQGTNASKEFIELLVVGTRSCTDSTLDLRNWVFDDHNGWYGGSGTGIAAGHYRFKDIPDWQAIPYGSIILIYNNGDRNLKIPVGSDDPTDANNDYVYVLPITSNLLEQNLNEPISPSIPTYVYPTSGYVSTVDWVSMGLANGGDAVVTVNPNSLGVASHSVVFGFTPAAGAQVPSVSKGAVGAGANLYLSDDRYNTAAAWTIGVAGSAEETPGEGNTAANITWINSMRVQSNAFTITTSIIQPTCATPTGEITVTSPNGAGYTYAINSGTFQSAPNFSGLVPGDYTVTVRDAGGCQSNVNTTILSAPGAPPVPVFTITHPGCNISRGEVQITSPLGPNYTYSINGTFFDPNPLIQSIAPGDYTLTVRDVSGCETSATFTMNPAPPTPSIPIFTIVQPTCTNVTGQLTITGPLGADISYSIDGTTFQPGTVFSNISPGNYTVTVRNDNGCTNTASFIIDAVPSQPVAPAVTSPVDYCLGETASPLTAVGTNLLWYSTSTGGTGNVSAPVPNTATAGATSYFVSQSVGGCESPRAEIVVNVNAFSLPEISGNNSICSAGNSTTTLTNAFSGGSWSSSNMSVATVDAQGLVTGITPGTTTITYSASSGSCTASVTLEVTVTSFDLALTGPASPVSSGTIVNLQTSSAVPYTISSWAPVDLFINQTLTSQSVALNQTTNISVVGSDAAGCTDTARLTVTVIPADEDVYIPGAFTPNNDGLNDLFVAYGNAIRTFEISVFNQWGELIYRGTDQGWNGRHKGKLQPSGVYVYVIKATMLSGKVIDRKGAINLVR